MYNSMASPVQMYAAEVWEYSLKRDTELMHAKFLKHVLFVMKRTSNDIVNGKLGVSPLGKNIKYRIINYWVTMIRGKNTILSYIMYCCLWQLDQLGIYSSPWLLYIEGVCNDCEMSVVWTSQNVVNSTWFKKTVN